MLVCAHDGRAYDARVLALAAEAESDADRWRSLAWHRMDPVLSTEAHLAARVHARSARLLKTHLTKPTT